MWKALRSHYVPKRFLSKLNVNLYPVSLSKKHKACKEAIVQLGSVCPWKCAVKCTPAMTGVADEALSLPFMTWPFDLMWALNAPKMVYLKLANSGAVLLSPDKIFEKAFTGPYVWFRSVVIEAYFVGLRTRLYAISQAMHRIIKGVPFEKVLDGAMFVLIPR